MLSPIFKRIDYYWREIFSIKDSHGLSKYPELTRLIKAILIPSHGNADPERDFSQFANFLTNSRTLLSEASISALQSTKDGLKQYENKVHSVPITNDFIIKGRNAHKSYLQRLEEDKRMKEEKKRERELQKQRAREEIEAEEARKRICEERSVQAKAYTQKEKDLRDKEEKNLGEIETYNSLLKEANDRIRTAMQQNDMKGVKIGQTMLDAACGKMQETTKVREAIRHKQKDLEKNQRTMLDYFIKQTISCKKSKKE